MLSKLVALTLETFALATPCSTWEEICVDDPVGSCLDVDSVEEAFPLFVLLVA